MGYSKEKIKEYSRQYYKKHRERIRRRAQKYYQTHKEERKKYKQQYRKRLRKLISNIKQNLGCQKCGETNPICLVFHHIDKSKKNCSIAYMVKFNSIGKVLGEMNKCIVLCRNCHAKVHFKKGESQGGFANLTLKLIKN